MSFKENWGYAGRISKILFVLIVIYAVFSLYVLACALDVLHNPMENGDFLWIFHAMASFVLATLIAAFHLSTMIFRRKRETDQLIHSHLGAPAAK